MTHFLVPLLLAAVAHGAFAQGTAPRVQPPPLPPGSEKIHVEPGLNKLERERHIRAHHHKGHHKKDIHLDDSKLPAQPGKADPGKTGNGK